MIRASEESANAMLRRSQLQTKLIIAFVLVLLIPTGIIAFYSINTANGTLIAKISAEELRSVIAQSSAIESRLSIAKSDILFLSQAPSTRRYIAALVAQENLTQAAETETQFLRTYLGRTPQYKVITILSLSGREIVRVANVGDSGPALDHLNPANQSGLAYFNQAIGLLAGQVYISEYDLSATNGSVDVPHRPIIRYSTPLQSDNGNVVGVIAIEALLQPIWEDIFAKDPANEIYLINKDGSYLLGPDPSRLYGRILKNGNTLDNDQPHDVRLMFSSKQGTILASADRPDSLQAFAHIKLAGQIAVQWLLIRQRAISNLLQEVTNAQLVILGIAALSLIVAIAMAVFFTRNIVRPVRQLVHTADAISRGEWDTPIPAVNSQDEISHFVTAFQRMLRELRALYDGLENRVAARTAELESTNRQLVIAQQKAEQASRAKSVFLSNVSHELRTPLNVIIGYSSSMLEAPEMFDRVPIPEIYRPYLKLIETNGHYLVGLINDILDLSKIESGKLDLHFDLVDLGDIFRGVVSTAVGLLKNKPVHIQPDIPADFPFVWADALRVRQIILNLMSNAIKFTEVGQVTLSGCVDGQKVRISVSDTGIGIPEHALATIFDRFKQVEQDVNKQYGGTGLGLDISKQLCLLHDSDLTVTSTPGKGSTFTFWLPLATPEQMNITETPQRAYGAVTMIKAESHSLDTSIAILLAEDEMATRDLSHRVLEGAGHAVIDTNDGTQAVELAGGLLPSLVIVDGDSATLNKWRVLDDLQANPATKAISLIVCVQDEELPQATIRGVTPIRKSQIESDLLNLVARVLRPAGAANAGY